MQVTDSNTSNFKQNNFQHKEFYRSMVFRIFILMCLLAACLIPTSMLNTLMDNKIEDYHSTSDKLTQHWNAQTVIGPILSIPYVERISRIETQTDSNGVRSSVSKDIFNNRTLILLPENLRIDAELTNKVITKDQHDAHTYQAEITLSGNFNLESLPEPSAFNTIEWDNSLIAIGLNDNKSVEVISPLRWEGSSTVYKPGTNLQNLLENGLHANLEAVANDNPLPEFKIQLVFKGTRSFQFAPFGKLTTAKISSDSTDASIYGDIPEESKVSSNEGFEANWRITNLKRDYPQEWLIDEDEQEPYIPNFSKTLTGIQLTPPSSLTLTHYKNIKTIIAYLIPMLSILFLSLVILEFKRNSRAKPKFIHYLVISLPSLLIPVILLSLINIIPFIEAYQIVIGGCLFLTMVYLLNTLKNFTHTLYILLIISTLYALLFVIIQMPNYELFAGSIAGAFIILLLMIASANIQEDQ